MHDFVNAFIARFEIPGRSGGSLEGMTFAAKDIFDVAGHMTGCGSPDWARTHQPATQHAPPVEMLLAAGARLVGKSHTDEIAYSLMGANAHYGTPVNTRAPDRLPGGSSSGSAAATAAGLVDIGLGSDTGGSVRLPASFCGIYGIRTTHGAIPLERTMPLAPSFDTAGWFARDTDTFARAGLAFGIEPQRPGKVRLLLPVDAWSVAEDETTAALSRALDHLQAQFDPASVTRISQSGLDEWREVFRVAQAAEIWAVHGAWVEAVSPNFGPGVRQRFEMASRISQTEAAEARAARERMRIALRAKLAPDTFLVVPTAPAPAPRLDVSAPELDRYRARALELLSPAGIAGLPQMNIPAGIADGAPVGLSLIGTPGSDGQLLALATMMGVSDMS